MIVRRGIWLLALLALPLTAGAAGFDVAAGPSLTSSGRLTGAVFGSVYGSRPDDGSFHIAPIGTVGWLASRNIKVDNLDHSVGVAGGGVRISLPVRHWFVSEQVLATSTRTDALSSRFEFATSAGWQGDRYILMLRHISNGRLIGHGKNLGETMVLAGIRW